MTETTTGDLSKAARAELRNRALAIAPSGLLWLDSAGLAHPEGLRAPRLPFIFCIGRLTDGARAHTVREVELVLAALAPEESPTEALDAYARFVVASAPTIHARLTGRSLVAWRASEANV